MWYFENQTRDMIAEHLDVDASTISRNKTRLINELKILLFADEVLKDIFD
jgi:DNA-directed RNA polymerase specialized sigma subunit